MSRTWTLTILAPCEWLTANRNSAHMRWARSNLTRLWRQAVVDVCTQGQLPKGLDVISVDAIARFRGRPPVRDRENLRPTLKAAIDGLTRSRRYGTATTPVPGYGLIVDDNDKHLAPGTDIRIGEPLPKTTIADHPGLLILTIREHAKPQPARQPDVLF